MEERRLSQQTTQAPTGSDLDLEREPTQEEIWRKPWKYKGYPAFATWMASADDFMVLRRFSRLNARVLLLMQDRIVQKEEELDRMDVSSRKCSTADYDGNCSTFRFEPCMRRREVLEELEPMLKEYNEYLVSFSQIRSWHTAHDYQVESVQNWFHNNGGAIDDREQEYIHIQGDVVSLVRRPETRSQPLLNRLRWLLSLPCFQTRHRANHVDSKTTLYFNHKTFEAFITGLILVVGLALLVGPMWWLTFLTDNVKASLGVVTGFILLFTVVLASATSAKPFEVLAATAAYSAVLMVFLPGSFGNKGGGGSG